MKLREILLSNNCTHAISGMALGIDTLFALVAIDNHIPLECAIPCLHQDKMWVQSSRNQYKKILSASQFQTLVTNSEYTQYCMQRRNEYMVDNCDLLIAVWDGTSGGTANCVRYAVERGTKIIYINPRDFD